MLTATQSKSIDGALKYFDNSLSVGDYYTGTEINGTWNGKGADILGLGRGTEVTRDQFKALLSGLHPVTGKKIAQRIRKDRRPGFDLTFGIPKSVSLAWAINGDEAILDALRETVHECMSIDVEPLMCRRVRAGDKAVSQHRAKTGNLIYADFLHKTSRPVNGIADPHLHIHAFVMNTTTHDGKHYAAEPEEIFRERASLQAKFEARLARRLKYSLGYDVERVSFLQSGRMKAGWELKGIHRSTIEKFSTRTQQIEEFANEHGVTDAAAKGKLGKKTRDRKNKEAGVSQLRSQWQSRLSASEQQAFEALRNRAVGETGNETDQVKAAVKYALDHHLFRSSTVEKHVVAGTALEHGLTITPEQVEEALQGGEVIHRAQDVRGTDRQYLTTLNVLDAESRMIEFAREGRGTRMAIARDEHQFKCDILNPQQRDAVLHVLYSRDTVTAITGGAGTGKSTLMEEAAGGIKDNGKKLFVFAPSTGAREVLEEKGFENAQTVEHLLRNDELQAELKNQVMWIDEAGLVDVRSMNCLFDIAKAQNVRVVLSGDTRQHSSPRRGEAMRLLETEAGLNIAKIQEVQRQKGKYKRAVELISLGTEVIDEKSGLTGMLAGFDLLDQLGKIKEMSDENRLETLASRYLKSLKSKQSALIVSPTHAEGKEVTGHIRAKLKLRGAIGKEDLGFKRLQALNLTEAQKRERSTYSEQGMVIQFHQNVKGGFKRGERYRVARKASGETVMAPINGGIAKPIPVAFPDRFEVYTERDVGFAVGDKIRFSLGGTATDGKRKVSNGRLDQVSGFDLDGNLKLKSGMTIAKDFGHFDLGYVITSHASQGKDRDVSIAAIGSQSLPAVHAKQFYVSVSRGRKDVVIFVEDKLAVRRAIQNAGEQLSATELVHGKSSEKRQQAVRQVREQRAFLERVRNWWRAHCPQRSLGTGKSRATGNAFVHNPELSRS